MTVNGTHVGGLVYTVQLTLDVAGFAEATLINWSNNLKQADQNGYTVGILYPDMSRFGMVDFWMVQIWNGLVKPRLCYINKKICKNDQG